jgi:hypothetical protein
MAELDAPADERQHARRTVLMVTRMVLVIALAFVVGLGVSKVFEQGRNTQQAAESGEQLDAALSGDTDLTRSERWYDNSSTIGLMAGGVVFVVGVVIVVVMRPKVL